MSNPGAGISREIATGDRADAKLDAFVSRRDKQRRETERERAVEDLWQARERLDNARRRRELEAEWCGWHRSRAALYARMSAEHEALAERLEGGAA